MTPKEFKIALLELGWSQGEFSRKTGVHRNAVSKWMVGKTKEVPPWVGPFLEMAVSIKHLSRLVD